VLVVSDNVIEIILRSNLGLIFFIIRLNAAIELFLFCKVVESCTYKGAARFSMDEDLTGGDDSEGDVIAWCSAVNIQVVATDGIGDSLWLADWFNVVEWGDDDGLWVTLVRKVEGDLGLVIWEDLEVVVDHVEGDLDVHLWESDWPEESLTLIGGLVILDVDSELVAFGVAVIPGGGVTVAVIVNNEWEVWGGILVAQVNVWGVVEAHVCALPEVSHTEEEDDFNVVILNAGVLISSEVVHLADGVPLTEALSVELEFNIGVAITDEGTTFLRNVFVSWDGVGSVEAGNLLSTGLAISS